MGVEIFVKGGKNISVITARSDDTTWKKPRTLGWL
jgi:hypothetical protein